jgi:serine phosphatase RsbU (regulator of sigma subunit)/anti-sigma regulatory factor (Ser/Thr protein kinase)
MNGIAQSWWRVLGRGRPAIQAVDVRPVPVPEQVEAPPIDIAPNDPLLAYFQNAAGAVDLETLELDSPARTALRAAGVKLVVPLVSQGELIGLLNLGPRLSDQDYSRDDRKLLENLAAQAAPAVRVAQLVREQEAEIRTRERLQQEMQVARLIQQHFLPRDVPHVAGWEVAAHYEPARAVGGDFYDFIELPNGQLGLVIGDVTDKGVPAALVMSATRTLLRASAQRMLAPGDVLERVNDVLVDDIPPNMFVTCLYAVLELASGRLRYANAGHNLPYLGTEHAVLELRARGMPLGLMPRMKYEESEATLSPGDHILLHTDGLAEAHNAARDMFGFPRLKALLAGHPGGSDLIPLLLAELENFTGADREREDDVTLVTVRRLAAGPSAGNGSSHAERVLADFSVSSLPGSEREAIDRVVHAVGELGLPARQIERLETAVGEATMNAIEHGNQNRPELPVFIRVLACSADLRVDITDQGGYRPIPDAETPDLEAKLAGTQRARGWGLFLIKNMVDEMEITGDDKHHTIHLTFHLSRKGAADATATV